MNLSKGKMRLGIVLLLTFCAGLASAQDCDSLKADNEILINYARMLESDLAECRAEVSLLEIAAEKDSLLCWDKLWWAEQQLEAEREAAPGWWDRFWLGALVGVGASVGVAIALR